MNKWTQDRLALEEAIAQEDYAAAHGALFRVLYGAFLSTSLQVCGQALARLAGGSEAGQSPWVAELLADPIAWANQHGRELGALPAQDAPGLAALRSGLDALLLSTEYLHDSAVVARAFCVALDAAIEGQADLAGGPEAAAARKREWLAIAEDLREHFIDEAPDADQQSVEVALVAFRHDEYRLRGAQ